MRNEEQYSPTLCLFLKKVDSLVKVQLTTFTGEVDRAQIISL